MYLTSPHTQFLQPQNPTQEEQPQQPSEETGEKGEELVVVSDLPVGSEQDVVEQVLEQYINQGHNLSDLNGPTTATAVINGQEVQVHIIRADAGQQQELEEGSMEDAPQEVIIVQETIEGQVGV